MNSRDGRAVPLDPSADSYFSNPIFPLNLKGLPSQYEIAMLNIDYTQPNNKNSGVFIYSDVCGMSRIGSAMANILTRIPRQIAGSSSGQSAHFDVRNLEWRPLNSTSINQIEIKRTFYDGTIVPSGSFSTFITLAIRRKPSF